MSQGFAHSYSYNAASYTVRAIEHGEMAHAYVLYAAESVALAFCVNRSDSHAYNVAKANAEELLTQMLVDMIYEEFTPLDCLLMNLQLPKPNSKAVEK